MNAIETVQVPGAGRAPVLDSAPRASGAAPSGQGESVDPGELLRERIEGIVRRESATATKAASWIATTDPQALPPRAEVKGNAIVNLARINNIRRINRFIRVANSRLEQGGIYICTMETLAQRWNRVFGKYPAPVALTFFALTFVLHRVLPKLPYTKQLYFRITGGHNRLISEAEALGRLVCCGFEIVETLDLEGRLFIVARKVAVTDPAIDPSYGPFFRAPRIGHLGKEIRVLKLRTMHPYSEYLQEYVFQRNALADGGKFRQDFRVTGWGRIFRRYWLDEIPMLVNWISGDLKLVGVRPLSRHFASLYPDDLRLRRQATKPGLIPPFYADLPITFEQILASEERYLASYERGPIRTDLRYLRKAVWNIVFRKARSA